MLNINKILLPVDFPHASLGVIHQAATLAHHFRSEIVMLHIVAKADRVAGASEKSPERKGWDLLAEIIEEGQKNLDQSLGKELDGVAIHRVSVNGDAARAIALIAQEEKVDLIMLPCHGHTFGQFLLGTPTAKGQHRTECPVWIGAHVEESPAPQFAIRHILCAVDFSPHDRKTVLWATNMAAEFGARLTLAHVTAGVEFWGPGGGYVNKAWKEALVDDASQHIAEIQHDAGTNADVYIGSGNLAQVLSQAARQTKADLLITGCRPYGDRLRTHGYPIICALSIPVLSV